MITTNPHPTIAIHDSLGVSKNFADSVLDVVAWVFTEPNITVNQAIAAAIKECDPVSPNELFFVGLMCGAATIETNLHNFQNQTT